MSSQEITRLWVLRATALLYAIGLALAVIALTLGIVACWKVSSRLIVTVGILLLFAGNYLLMTLQNTIHWAIVNVFHTHITILLTRRFIGVFLSCLRCCVFRGHFLLSYMCDSLQLPSSHLDRESRRKLRAPHWNQTPIAFCTLSPFKETARARKQASEWSPLLPIPFLPWKTIS